MKSLGPQPKILSLLLIIAAAAVIFGCSQWATQWSTVNAPFAPLSESVFAAEANYSYVQSNMLIPYCISCHGSSGGVSLESIDGIRQNSESILKVVADHSMPKGPNNMNEEQRRVLWWWVKNGAPVGSGPVQLPYKTFPPLSDDEAAQKLNYTYIRDTIFIPKCISCHTGARQGKPALDDLNSIQQN